MKFFLLFLVASFVGGVFLAERKRTHQLIGAVVLCLVMIVLYYFMNKI